MRLTTTCILFFSLALSAELQAGDLSRIKAPDAEVEKVGGGFAFTEGPAWAPGDFLLFSDIHNNRIVRLRDGETKTFLEPSGRANGLMFDREGRLYACQGGARQVARFDLDDLDDPKVLAETYDGKKLNSPNDLALDGHGGLYFTDPRYGPKDDLEQPVMGVYYISASGDVNRVIDDLELPNGILVSPDGRWLSVADNARGEIHRYRILAPGKLAKGQLFFKGDTELDGRRGPDGMAHDARGNIYATYRSITVIDPGGEALGRIPVPERPANCTLGGDDGTTLYITARQGLYSVALEMKAPALEPGKKPETREVDIGPLALKVPETWTSRRPRSRMRVAELEVPAVPGDEEPAELVVYYFGGGGGGAAENVRRWIGQFDADDRESALYRGKAPAGKYVLLELAGTYNRPVGPPILGKSEPAPGSRVLGVRLETERGPYFLKLAGPERTVAAAAESFRAAFGADPASEEEIGIEALDGEGEDAGAGR